MPDGEGGPGAGGAGGSSAAHRASSSAAGPCSCATPSSGTRRRKKPHDCGRVWGLHIFAVLQQSHKACALDASLCTSASLQLRQSSPTRIRLKPVTTFQPLAHCAGLPRPARTCAASTSLRDHARPSSSCSAPSLAARQPAPWTGPVAAWRASSPGGRVPPCMAGKEFRRRKRGQEDFSGMPPRAQLAGERCGRWLQVRVLTSGDVPLPGFGLRAAHAGRPGVAHCEGTCVVLTGVKGASGRLKSGDWWCGVAGEERTLPVRTLPVRERVLRAGDVGDRFRGRFSNGSK